MTSTLPPALRPENEQLARGLLDSYSAETGRGFTGRWFDTWDPDGRRASDADRLASDDIVALSFLSIEVPARAAQRLLVDQREELNGLLAQVPDGELADVEAGETYEGWHRPVDAPSDTARRRR